MSYRHHQHNQTLILKFADDAVIPHPVTPQTESASSQWFAELARILRSRHALIHVIDDLALHRTIRLLQIAQRFGIVFDGPVQWPSSPINAELLANLAARQRGAALFQARLGEIAVF